MSNNFFIKTLTACNVFITKKEKRMGFINLATLGVYKTLGVSKNGTKVIEQFAKNGERVLSGFKPNSEIPFKQIVFHKNRVINNAQQYTSNLHSLNITEKHVTVNEIGKESKDKDSLPLASNDRESQTQDSSLTASNDKSQSTSMLHPILEDNEIKYPHNGVVKLKSNKGKSFISKMDSLYF